MDRACDGGRCHSGNGDWQEEKKKKTKMKPNNPKPVNNPQLNGMTSRRQKI